MSEVECFGTPADDDNDRLGMGGFDPVSGW